MNRPLLVYDGTCTVCVRQLEKLRDLLGDRFDCESFREPNFFQNHPRLRQEECEKAIQLVHPNGNVYAGAEAVARTLGLRHIYYPLTITYYIPGFRSIWESFYRAIARRRLDEISPKHED